MRRVLPNVIIVICLIIFAVCTYKLVEYFYGNMEADNKFNDQRNLVAGISKYDERQPEYKKMKQENSDFEGWIIADGTNVNYPTVQREDDQNYYLYRDFYGNDSKPGSIFLSTVADLYEPSDLVTVFGHNMKDGTMFGSLRRYEDSQFLEEHDRIWLDSLEGRREFQVTHVMRIRVDVEGSEDVFPYYQYSNFENKKEFNNFINQCNSHSLYSTGRNVEYGDKLVILSTCEYTYGDGSGRLVVMGKEVPKKQETNMASADITKPMMGTYVMIGIAAVGALIIILIIANIVKSVRRRSKRYDA